jgi:glycosyltransferase involved in cell wall biosynthesis
MQILFYNSSLEPGRDGVGDYVRLLAAACTRLGHRCATVALHDPFVAEPVHSAWEDGTISARLPAAMSWRDRVALVGDFRKSFRADWISFQLVPYGFQERGILLGLCPIFHALTADSRLHFMFHELWVGAGRPCPWRHYLTGTVQMLGVRRVLAQTRPALVTTSNPVYASMLRSLKVDAEIVPLFGNVPVEKTESLPPIGKLLPGAQISEENRADWWIGLFFGALHEEWKPEPIMSLLLRAAQRAGKQLCLALVGRSSLFVWNRLEAGYGNDLTLIYRGEQPLEVISALLQKADFGLAASPWQLIGKSGTVAAMLDHGLPVIVPRDDFHSIHRTDQPPSVDPLLHRCDERLEAKLLAGLPRRLPRSRVDDIAAQLCGRLRELNQGAP